MKKRKGIVSLVLGFIIALGVFSGGTTEASTVYLGNFPMVQGQIGRVTILKTTTLWKLGSNSQLTFSRTLHPGRQYRVYNFRSIQGGLYGLGGGYYVEKNPTYVKYETPSKSKLAKLNSSNRILSSGVPIQGKITSSMLDAQVYHFSTDKNGEVSITVDQTAGGLILGIFNNQGKNITELPIDHRGAIIHENLAKGTYSVILGAYDWNRISIASYRLKVVYP